jgi:hypothetical protein
MGLTYMTSTASAGSYSIDTGVWSIPTLTLNTTEVLTVEVVPMYVGVVTNTATLMMTNEPDVDNTNNFAVVTTTVEMVQYGINLGTNGTGSGMIETDPVGPLFDYGTVVTLTAVPDTNSSFIGWSGDVTGTDSIITVLMDMTKTITATFALNQYTLTVAKDGPGTGAVQSDPAGIDCGPTCAADFDAGTVITLTATADPGSTFVGWSGDVTSTDSVIQVTLDMAMNVTATFAFEEHYLYIPIVFR